MSCRKINQQITQYLDGELPNDQAVFLEEHIEECPACMQLLEEEQKLWGLLKSWPGVTPSPDFTEKFWRKAASLPDSPRWWTRVVDFFRPEGLLAPSMALALSIFLCVWVYTREVSITQTSRQAAIPSLSADAVEAVISPMDKEVVHHLAFLEKMDMLRQMDVISNLEVLTVMGSRMSEDSLTHNVSH